MLYLVICWGAFIGFLSGIYIAKYCKWRWKFLSSVSFILGAIYSVLVFKTNYSLVTALYLIVVSAVLFIGATIDSQIFILPNEGAILLIFMRLIYSLANTDIMLQEKVNLMLWQILVAAFWGIIFYLIRYLSKKALGLGDVKWIFAIAFIIPWEETYNFITYSFLLGSFYVICKYLWNSFFYEKDKIKNNMKYIPFGPFLALSALFILLQKAW